MPCTATGRATDSLTLLPAQLIPDMPRLYAQDGLGLDATVHLHIFSAGSDWWITEVSEDGTEAFGYVRHAAMPDCAELGYIHLPELQARADAFKANPGQHFSSLIERDLHWQPCTIRQAIAA